VYALYSHYGFTRKQNGVLFIAGFGCSMVPIPFTAMKWFGGWVHRCCDSEFLIVAKSKHFYQPDFFLVIPPLKHPPCQLARST